MGIVTLIFPECNSLPYSPLSAVVQAIDLAMRLLQVELVGHGRGNLRDLNLVSNLKYSLSEELTVLSRSLPEDTVCRSVQSSCDQWPA